MIVPVECELPPEQDELADTHWGFVNSMAKALVESLLDATPQYGCECVKSNRHALLLSSVIVSIASATVDKLLSED